MSTSALPTGTITFLFTDVEGSTKLWESQPDAMQAALVRHDTLLQAAIAGAGGTVFKTIGDAFCAAFANAPAALDAAASAQNALQKEVWPEAVPLRVRMALHTGTVEERDSDYFGPVLNRVARLLSAGHGGQTLLSAATYELVRDRLPDGVTLRDLGSHRLKDLERPEHVFQVTLPGLMDAFAPLRTLDNTPNNLPQQVTSFIGREKPLGDVQSLLNRTRLLTLTGSGGSGKTRLSLQAAADVLDAYPDGAWLVELASLSDPALVPQTVAAVLGVKEQAGQTMTQTLTEHLKTQSLFLVLDNCEHVLAACAQLTAALLRACPGVRVLATSREPLGIAGEQTYRVPSLSLPDPKAAKAATPESVSQFEAVRLFIERAQAVKPDFAVTNANAPALAQISFRLDGIPLALELAAARVRSLPVEQINDKLDSRFRILTGGDRSALPRQQTLRALVDWSYDLLSETEKTLFARLSVFAGGWDLQAAESVCGFEPVGDWEVLDVLTSLVDKSLVIADEAEGAARYRMLETLRQYGAERLEAAGEADKVQTRHLNFFVTFAEEAEPKLSGPEQGKWLNHLEAEHDNMRAALAWRVAADARTNTEVSAVLGLRLVGALFRFWQVRGYLSEGREQIARSLVQEVELRRDEKPEQEALRAKALGGGGLLAVEQGDYASAKVLLNESLSLSRALGNKQGMAFTLNVLGNMVKAYGDYAAARSLYEESLVLRRELGDKNGIAASLNNLGNLALRRADFAAAQSLYEESLVIFREIGNKGFTANALCNLGGVASNQGDYEAARAIYQEALTIDRELGDKNNISNSLMNLASVFLHGSAFRVAALLWGACDTLRESIGATLPPNGQAVYTEQLNQTRSALGDTAFSDAWNEGRALSMEQAIEYALKQKAE